MSDEIRLEYTATAAELRAASRYATRWGRATQYFIAVAMMTSVLLALAPIVWQFPLMRWVAAITGLVVILSVVWRTRALFERRLDEQLTDQPGLLATTRLHAHAGGLTLARASSESTFGWGMISGVSPTRTGVLLHTGGNLFWFVPNSAFPDLADKADFCERVARWRAVPAPPPETPPFEIGPQDRVFEAALTDADYAALSRFAVREALAKRGWRPWIMPLQLLLVGIAASLFLGLGTGILAFTAAGLIGLLWIAPTVSIWFLPWRIRRLRRQLPGRFPAGEQQMVVGPDGMRLRSAVARVESPWGSIVRVEDDAEHIFLFLGPQTAYIIPKRLIAPGEAADLLARWTAWRDAAPRRIGLAVAPRGKSTESNNPFEPPTAL